MKPSLRNNTSCLLVLLSACAIMRADATISTEVEEVKTLTAKWVEVEKLRSQESVSGKQQMDTLDQLESVLNSQIESWKTKVAELEKTMTSADKIRQSWLDKEKAQDEVKTVALAMLDAIEMKLKALVPRIPLPLAKELEAPMRQMQIDKKWLGRYQACLSIIKGLRDFSRAYTTTTQDIDLGPSKTSVEVLYIGLTKAYFKTIDSKKCGVGLPTESGWSWQEQPALMEEIQMAIALNQRRSTDLRMVSLPVEVQ